MRLHQSDVEAIKVMAPFVSDTFDISIGILEGLKIIWHQKSEDFYIEVFEVGKTV